MIEKLWVSGGEAQRHVQHLVEALEALPEGALDAVAVRLEFDASACFELAAPSATAAWVNWMTVR